MAEKNPFIHAYGESQGRLTPLGWTPTDGQKVYVLGDENLGSFNFLFNDYVEIKEDLDLSGYNILRVDSRIIQPTMPVGRNVAIDSLSVHTATLKRGHVLQHRDLRTNTYEYMVHPGSETQLKEPYNILASSVLRIEVDGGGDFDITFPASPPVLTLTAEEVVNIINAALTLGGIPAEARQGWDTEDPTVIITADSTGNTATFEIKDYPGSDANERLQFFQKVARPLATDTKIYGGDDLSAIVAPDANFSAEDSGRPVRITGAVDPGNNVTNHLIAIISSTQALLKLPITSEAVGFDAEIRPCLWEISLHVDGTEVFSKKIRSSKTVDTNDIAANVSKLTGTYEVLFRFRLRLAS